MKPLFLEMSGFGAFGGLEQIDFTRISSGLFLIYGETGAGKTTVFDAISYALYGEMSGSVRETKSVRSDFAAEDTITYVRLIFNYRGKEYEIYRSPSFQRKKLKGGGTTLVRGRVELKLPDGSIFSDEKTVKAKVFELLGLNCSQWKQVAMIAQGEFTKCLHTSGEERSAIFRSIFETSFYAQFSARLKELELLAKRNYDNIILSLFQYADNAILDAAHPKSGDFTIALENRTIDGITTAASILRKITISGLERHTELSNDCEMLQKRLDEKKLLIENANMLNKSILEMEKEKKEMERLIEEKPLIDAEKLFIQRAEAALGEMSQLSEQLKKHKEAEKQKEEIYKLAERLSIEEQTLRNFAEEKEKLYAEREKSEILIKKHKDTELLLMMRANELGKIEESMALIKRLIMEAERYNELRNEYKAAKTDFEKLETKSKEAEAEYFEKNQLYIRGQAVILAEGLTDGSPCPVCGSISHPAKAGRIKDVPSEEALKSFEKSVSEAAAKARTAEIALSAKRAEGIEARKNIIRETGKYIDGVAVEANVGEAVDKLNVKMKELEENRFSLYAEVNKLKTDRKTFKAAEIDKERISVLLESIDASEKKHDNQINHIKNLISLKEGELGEINKAISHMTKEEVEQRQRDIADELGLADGFNISERMEIASKHLNDYNNNQIKNSTKIDMLTKSIKDRQAIDIAEMEGEAEGIFNEKKRHETEKADSWASYKANSSLLEKITKGLGSLIEEEKKYVTIESLSKTANGELKGKRKLTLEMYVQRAFFSKILKTANLRLRNMTAGQFELLRKNSPDNLRDKSFALDLDVLDNHTGKVRDVSSLSGGETFMAALSLALALSDTIQSEAGGVEINTMFIDEGFGSLSPEYLRRVVEALSAMSEREAASGKMIGVISHVDLLKDSISKQILVTRNAAGSRTKIITSW